MAELEEWRHENKGLALLLAVDSLIRKKVHRLNHDQRKRFPTFSVALVEVLNNHKQLWNDARSSAELDKFKQAGQQAEPSTPIRSAKRSLEEDSPLAGNPDKKSRNQKRRARQKEILRQAKQTVESKKTAARGGGDKVARDARVPAAEWSKITSFKYSGKKRCPFFNCSLGCRFGDTCKNAHLCVECGQPHSWHGNHWMSPVGPAGDQGPPPADHSGPPSSGSNDEPMVQAQTAPPDGSCEWSSWQQVLRDPREVARHGPWFLEVFSGTARLTASLKSLGIRCLPPIDIMVSELVPDGFDVVDAELWDFVMQLILLGAVFFMHFGTPCNTFSSARKEDGGPPPLRSAAFPDGLPDLDLDLFLVTFLGNLFVERTAEACCALAQLGKDFSIEKSLVQPHLEHPSLGACCSLVPDVQHWFWSVHVGCSFCEAHSTYGHWRALSSSGDDMWWLSFTYQAAWSRVEWFLSWSMGLQNQACSRVSVQDVRGYGTLHQRDCRAPIWTFGSNVCAGGSKGRSQATSRTSSSVERTSTSGFGSQSCGLRLSAQEGRYEAPSWHRDGTWRSDRMGSSNPTSVQSRGSAGGGCAGGDRAGLSWPNRCGAASTRSFGCLELFGAGLPWTFWSIPAVNPRCSFAQALAGRARRQSGSDGEDLQHRALPQLYQSIWLSWCPSSWSPSSWFSDRWWDLQVRTLAVVRPASRHSLPGRTVQSGLGNAEEDRQESSCSSSHWESFENLGCYNGGCPRRLLLGALLLREWGHRSCSTPGLGAHPALWSSSKEQGSRLW